MTVSTEISHEEYTGNGVTTTFPYRFRITNSSFMLVKTADLDGNETTLVLNTDYTLTGVKSYSGGNVVLTNALPIGWRILLERNMPLLQGTDLRNQGSYFAEVHEDTFDYMTMLIQKVAGWFNLALRRPSWISNHYDAQGYKISNVNTPTAAQDAASKSYVDGEIGSANANAEALFGRTLRVPGSYIAPLPPLADGEGKTIVVQGGVPRWITPESGTATDVLIQLADPTGASIINTTSGLSVQQEINTLHSKTSDSVAVSQYPSLSDALMTGKHVLIDTDIVINDIITSNNEGQKVIGFDGKITINTDTGRYRQIHAGCSVESLEIETTGGLYAITIEADDCTVDSVIFSGDCGHYVFSVAAKRPNVSNCTVDGIGQITPFVFQGCSDFTSTKNNLINHSGFGIQARWCNGGVISENITINDVIKVSLAAVPAQTVYAFTVAKNYARYGFYIQDANGSTARPATFSYSSGVVTVTTTDPSVVVSGSAVLVACDALESYQINSGCSNIRIFNNKSDGTGDSNVVIGADYHYNGSEWELSPSDVVLSDFPTDNIIAFNELSNAIHSNIAINNSNKGLMISNNTLSHAGFNYDNSLVLDCNINCSFFSIITNNDIFVDAGVIRPRSAIASVANGPVSYSPGGELVTIGNNKIGVGFSGGKYTFGQGTSSVYRRNGVKVSDDYTALPVSIDAEIKKIWTTKPTDTDDLKFFSSSAGWIRNTTDQLYGAACLQTTSSGYVDVVLANPRCLYKSIVKISFMAKGVGFLRAFSDVIGTTLPVAVSVSNAEWESFEILIPFDGLSSFFLRIGSDAGQSCLFDLLDIKTLRLDI